MSRSRCSQVMWQGNVNPPRSHEYYDVRISARGYIIVERSISNKTVKFSMFLIKNHSLKTYEEVETLGI
jgi:hypothetical protein